MKRKAILALLLAAALLLSGCSLLGKGGDDPDPDDELVEPELEEYPVQVGDYTVLSRPRRVVSLSPALTEKLYDLELEDRLVGVSNFCDYPAGAQGLPQCGTALMPDLDTIDNVDAHMVISETPLPAADIAQLEQWDIDFVVIPHATSLQSLYGSYRSLCRVMEGEYAGGEMGEAFVQDLDAFVSRLRQSVSGEERKDALYIRKLPFTVATGGTLENDLLDVIGLNNVLSSYTGWSIDEEEARGNARERFESVDVMFFDVEELTIKDLEGSDFYKSLRATLQDLYLEIDSTVMERQSLRTFRQLLDMAAYAYPNANIPVFQLGGTAPAASPAPDDGGDGPVDEIIQEPEEDEDDE